MTAIAVLAAPEPLPGALFFPVVRVEADHVAVARACAAIRNRGRGRDASCVQGGGHGRKTTNSQDAAALPGRDACTGKET